MTMTVKIIDSKTQWPWPLVSDIRRRNETAWVEVDEDAAYQMLTAVPPLYFKGGFFMGEPATHVLHPRTADMVPVYAAVVKINDRHFVREVPQTTVAAAVADLREALAHA